MGVVEFGPHDLAVAETLRAADIVVAIAQVPRVGQKLAGWRGSPGGSNFVRYVVVWPEQTLLGGTLDDPEEDADLAYNLHSWAATATGARLLSDECREALQAISVEGRSVLRIAFDHSLGVARDPEFQPDAWCAKDRYRLFTTPDT